MDDQNNEPEDICSILNITETQKELITFVGAGGKTTSMFKLAGELKAKGKKVLITTTTAIFCPLTHEYDSLIVNKKLWFKPDSLGGFITVWGREVSDENKLLGVDKVLVDDLFASGTYDYILVEGDGSKRKPIKAPAEHEPVIPKRSTKVAALIGMDAYGKRIGSGIVHRPEIYSSLTKSSLMDFIGVRDIVELITEKKGIYKDVPEGCEKYLILNKSEGYERVKAANEIIEELKRKDFLLEGYFIGSILDIG